MKHPAAIRWTHWIHFFLISVMIWSGILIYWANAVYWPVLPESFYAFFHLDHRLAEGMAFHFFFMWFFGLNGALYVGYLFISGEWREFVFSGKEKFNRGQKIAYTLILLMAAGALITGVAIYKPVQESGLTRLLGGYETARLLHYGIMVGFIVFFLIHVTQVIRAGKGTFRSMVTGSEEKKSARAWGVFAGGLVLMSFSFFWIRHQESVDEIPWILRRGLEFNERLGMILFDPRNVDKVKGTPKTNPRLNGELGLATPLNLETWVITVSDPAGTGTGRKTLSLKMSDLKKLPRTEILTRLKCIEGWSEVMSFAGVKFSDFLEQYHLGTHSGESVDFDQRKEDLFSHVGLSTPDGEYYVSVDMKSMLSPQTLLAYEMNGFPLTLEHGAPLRLIIPNKYGVKSLKRIGKIQFADVKLPDYWGEQGYDWFIGL